MDTWGAIDVWVSHKPPSRFPRFPYHGAVSVRTPPLFVIGSSMTEVHRVPPEWVERSHRLVDELWIPLISRTMPFLDSDVQRHAIFGTGADRWEGV